MFLSLALVASYEFWYVFVFLLFKIFSHFSSFLLLSYLEVYCWISRYLRIDHISLLLISSLLNGQGIEKKICCLSKLVSWTFIFHELFSYLQNMVCQKNVCLKRCLFCCGWLKTSVRSNWIIMLLRTSVNMLIFCLLVLSNTKFWSLEASD